MAIAKKFDGVLQRSNQCGMPNAKVRYDQHGNVVISEERDYLGTLISAVRVDPQGKPVRAGQASCGLMHMQPGLPCCIQHAGSPQHRARQ
jgi:hypothetical protein